MSRPSPAPERDEGEEDCMEISVVIPTYNRRKIVCRTLETLFAQSVPAPAWEVIVVVDGSTDGTAEAVRAMKPPCRLRVIEQENRGLASARNTGLGAAEGNLVLFLDDDMLCDRNLVAEHLAFHREVMQAVALGAIFLSPDSPPSLAAECFKREIGVFSLRQRGKPDSPIQVTDCVFGNASLPREMLAAAGGFDESLRMREDLELGLRLFQRGVCVRHVPGAVAHQFYAKRQRDLIRDVEAFAVADAQLARKHPDARNPEHLSYLSAAPLWKRALRRAAAYSPLMADTVLAPVCHLCEALIQVPALRNLGVRALQIRRRIHWLHRLAELGALHLTRQRR
ncbi:MAG TPA: glycosyltransferase family A protein [Terracidiphilus sp.]|nr:glycosyltransferase family A protein [Terracidiphilus sp.]